METKFSFGVDFSRVSFHPGEVFSIDADFENSAILGLRTLRTPKIRSPRENSWGVRIFGVRQGSPPAGAPGAALLINIFFGDFTIFFDPISAPRFFEFWLGSRKSASGPQNSGSPRGPPETPPDPFLASGGFFPKFRVFFPKFMEFLIIFLNFPKIRPPFSRN